MKLDALRRPSGATLTMVGGCAAVALLSAVWGFLIPYQILKGGLQYTCRGLDAFEDSMFRGIPEIGIGPSTNWCALDAGSRVTASLALAAVAIIFGAVVVGVSYWRQPSSGN